MGMGLRLGLGLNTAAMGGGGPGSAPVNSVAPVVTGTGAVGSLLTSTTGTWTNTPTGYTYQWYRGASPIGGATSSTYTLVSADGGTTVLCAVTASNAIGAGSPANSNGIAVLAVPANTVAPTITGTPAPGNVLTCSTGTWTNTPTSYAYQWNRNGTALSGQTASTYTSVVGDVGTNLTCTVTASNASGAGTPVSTPNFPLYDTDAQAYFAAVVSNGGAALTTATKSAFNTFVVGLKADSVWTPLDRLAWLGNETAIAALTDIRTPSKLWSASGSPAFTALTGYRGDGIGASVSAVDAITAISYAQDNATIFVSINVQDATTGIMQEFGSSTQTSIALPASTVASSATARINSATAVSGTGSPAKRTGFLCGVRDATNSSRYFSPTTSTPQQTVANPAATAPGGVACALRRTTAFSPDGVLFVGYGTAMTGAQVLAFYNRTLTLAAALGNPVF